MIKSSFFALVSFTRRLEGPNFEKLAEGDPTEWTTVILWLASLAALFCFVLHRADQWKQIKAWFHSLTTRDLLGPLIGVVVPVLLVGFLGIAEYLLLVMLGGYLGAVLASRESTTSAGSRAKPAAFLIALAMSVRAYYVSADEPSASFPAWVFFAPAVFVATWFAAMLVGTVLFAVLDRRRTSGGAKTPPEGPPSSPSDRAPRAANQTLHAAMIFLILFIPLGGFAWQAARWAGDQRTLRRLNEHFSNHLRNGPYRLGIGVRWSKADPDASWWLELLRIRLGGSRLPRVTQLYGNKRADDESLKALQVLPNLSDLNLQKATITDAGLVHLQVLPSLRKIDLGSNNVSDEAVAALQKQLPQAQIKIRRPPQNALHNP